MKSCSNCRHNHQAYHLKDCYVSISFFSCHVFLDKFAYICQRNILCPLFKSTFLLVFRIKQKCPINSKTKNIICKQFCVQRSFYNETMNILTNHLIFKDVRRVSLKMERPSDIFLIYDEKHLFEGKRTESTIILEIVKKKLHNYIFLRYYLLVAGNI